MWKHLHRLFQSSISTCVQFSSVQWLSCVQLFATPWTAAQQASMSITNSWNSPKPMSIKSVMDPTMSSSVVPFSSCPQSFPAWGSFPMSRLFHIRSPKYWSFSFSISPFNEYSGLTSFRIDYFDPRCVTTWSWLSRSLRPFLYSSVYFCYLFLISSQASILQ